MSADIVRMLLVTLLPLAMLLALVAVLRRAMQIVRGWDAIAGGRR